MESNTLNLISFKLTYEVAIGKSPVPQFAIDSEKEGKLKVFVTDKIHNSQYAFIITEEGKKLVKANEWVISGKNGFLFSLNEEDYLKKYKNA